MITAENVVQNRLKSIHHGSRSSIVLGLFRDCLKCNSSLPEKFRIPSEIKLNAVLGVPGAHVPRIAK
jgi:hypothetical protein